MNRKPTTEPYACHVMGRVCLPGFTLLELMVVLTLMGAIATLTTPRVAQMYDNMRFQSAVRDLITSFNAARYQSIHLGRPVELLIDAQNFRYSLNNGEPRQLPDNVRLDMLSAGELMPGKGQVVYRFYPDGSASGGYVRVLRETAGGEAGTVINIDWLLGRISHESYSGG